MTLDENPNTVRPKPPVGRAGDATGEPPETEAVNRDLAANLANLLEDLEFPASKEQIKIHVNGKPPSLIKQGNVLGVLNNLKDNVTYNSVYEVEKDAGLVVDAEG